MGKVTIRSSQTSQGFMALCPWNDSNHIYSSTQLNLGNNPISSLEVVSALNSFNIAWDEYYYSYTNCIQKYNPKVYLGAVQSASTNWNFDQQNGQINGLGNLPGGYEKSGSWPILNGFFQLFIRCFSNSIVCALNIFDFMVRYISFFC